MNLWLKVATPQTAAVLPRVFRASRFLKRVFERQSDWALDALTTGAFEALPGQTVAARLETALAGAETRADVVRGLRRFRQRELARLALRDIAGWAPLDETLHGLSDLADAACAAALIQASRTLATRSRGVPAGAVAIVLGMGKLGGHELNFSSDIDLIFAYRRPSGVDPDATQDYFDRLARDTTQLLSTVTEDGFVFRVDTLLRPFGSAGAPTLSSAAMLAYYQTHGREWERYALIKARAVAGDRGAGESLLKELHPFVFRRYLDYGAIGALRDLKARVDADARRHGAADDLKLGPGGIRELEFVVQLFQLVRGGQDARLCETGLRATLAQLSATGVLDVATTTGLDDAYVFLRRAENALQLYDDQQTQHLPADAAVREALCAALDFPDWAAFRKRLNTVRERVREVFERVFSTDASPSDAPTADAIGTLWKLDGDELETQVRALGYVEHPEWVVARLVALRQSRVVRALGDAARTRLRECVGRLMAEAVALQEAETAIGRALDVVAAIGGRSTYLALLCESTLARAQLLRLTAASPWITQQLAQNPALLDTLLDTRLASEAPQRDTLFADLALRAGGLDGGDTEASMELLRRYRQEMMLRVAAADLSGALPLVQVSDRLTWLAEAVLVRALTDATTQLSARYGQPLRGDGTPGAFTAIAYGKFGSLELGYGSDLDLVFVFDIDDVSAQTEGGQRSLSAAQYFGRLGQRIVQLLSAMTGAGRAYEIDLELRPSGGSGAVVASFNSWARYQRESAWTWEHQALLRARPVAGDEQVGQAVEAVRSEVLRRARDPLKLRHEVREMRNKMRAGLEKRAAGCWDVKQGRGGLVDAEFLTQYLLLREAADHPELTRETDNWRQLDALAAARTLPVADAQALIAAGRRYRNWLHRRALQEADRLANAAQFRDARADVTRLWRRYMEDKA